MLLRLRKEGKDVFSWFLKNLNFLSTKMEVINIPGERQGDTLTNHHLDNSVHSYHFNFVVCYLYPSIFSNKVD